MSSRHSSNQLLIKLQTRRSAELQNESVSWRLSLVDFGNVLFWFIFQFGLKNVVHVCLYAWRVCACAYMVCNE